MQKLSPHSRNANNTRVEAVIYEKREIPSQDPASVRMEKRNPIRAAKIFGALSIQTGCTCSNLTSMCPSQLIGLYGNLVKALMKKSTERIAGKIHHPVIRKNPMATTTPNAVALTLFSSTLSGETGHIICLNCIISA